MANDGEALLLIKTQRKHFKRLQSVIKKLHPYSVPEIIQLAISAGSREYLQWLEKETKSPS